MSSPPFAPDLQGIDAAAPTAKACPALEPMGLPRAPVLGWRSLRRLPEAAAEPIGHAVDRLPHRVYLTSGRAAIYHALRQLALPAGAHVWVPTYHCPTIVAPVILAGLTPSFYPIDARGLPHLSFLDDRPGAVRVLVLPHYFGLPQSLADIRLWCDRNRVTLIEDCAHSLFGRAGDRPVGAWGDFATASLSKFLPVPEAGVLASVQRDVSVAGLSWQGAKAETKAFVDVLEIGAKYRKLDGFNALLNGAFRFIRGRPQPPGPAVPKMPDAEAMMRGCDMARIASRPLALSRWIAQHLPRAQIATRRRENYQRYLAAFSCLANAVPLRPTLASADVPYVFPLMVDDADFVYHRLRERLAPVFRWDHIWPGTPHIEGDTGALWSRKVLQLLCHQDLEPWDIDRVVEEILRALHAAAGSRRG